MTSQDGLVLLFLAAVILLPLAGGHLTSHFSPAWWHRPTGHASAPPVPEPGADAIDRQHHIERMRDCATAAAAAIAAFVGEASLIDDGEMAPADGLMSAATIDWPKSSAAASDVGARAGARIARCMAEYGARRTWRPRSITTDHVAASVGAVTVLALPTNQHGFVVPTVEYASGIRLEVRPRLSVSAAWADIVDPGRDEANGDR